ncbi:HAD-IA family hydrolase [Streptomyces inhibens]|uniref:HAD-IA family hydrolase n=1 Tax=Streptomyces inhibens TaxID=2293571 RepID=UPI0037AFF80B
MPMPHTPVPPLTDRASLLAVDLDNTLINRDAAFRSAAIAFLAEHDLPREDVEVIMDLDRSGHAPRPVVVAALAEHWEGAVSPETIAGFLHRGPAAHVALDEPVHRALLAVRAAGVPCVIVTNGRADQQEEKIRTAGLDSLVDGWVISESVGSRKPDPEIFHAAAAVAGLPALDRASTWMIGDAGHADVRGAVELGLRSVWVSGGRSWAETSFWPTHIAVDVVEAIAHVLGERPRLIRDRVPELVCQAEGRLPEVYQADAAEFRTRLRDKLREEVTALLAADPAATGVGEQLAEVLEVVHALAADLGISPAALQSLRRSTTEARGAFDARTIWTGRYASSEDVSQP